MNAPANHMEAYQRLSLQPHGDRIIAALEKIKVLSLRGQIQKHRAAHPQAQKIARVK